MNTIVEECMLKEEYTLYISGFEIRVECLLHICKCLAAKRSCELSKRWGFLDQLAHLLPSCSSNGLKKEAEGSSLPKENMKYMWWQHCQRVILQPLSKRSGRGCWSHSIQGKDGIDLLNSWRQMFWKLFVLDVGWWYGLNKAHHQADLDCKSSS